MSDDRKPASGILFGVGVLTLLIGLYFGAYYSLVVVNVWITSIGGVDNWHTFSPTYCENERLELWVEPLFVPAHWLDRRFRPHVWEP